MLACFELVEKLRAGLSLLTLRWAAAADSVRAYSAAEVREAVGRALAWLELG
jgi:hypothetical protein